jgi:hypothetical protein
MNLIEAMAMKRRVLVCGGRHYDGRNTLLKFLDELHAESPIGLIIQGGATGADSLAYYWAMSRRIPVVTMDANWIYQGKPAGHIRNANMLEWLTPDLVVAFPGGPGTEGMVKLAQKANIPVRRST